MPAAVRDRPATAGMLISAIARSHQNLISGYLRRRVGPCRQSAAATAVRPRGGQPSGEGLRFPRWPT